ncbi:MAG: hypothetical protein MJE68_26385 [Proteobacteria bacterium]|nr:hypothetical protein [Pseudomonadota bacterium]
MGLTEMLPDRAWNWLSRGYSFSYWLAGEEVSVGPENIRSSAGTAAVH